MQEDEVIDEVVKEAISKPWLPLPLGLKPPSTESVLAELCRQGIPNIPPNTYWADTTSFGSHFYTTIKRRESEEKKPHQPGSFGSYCWYQMSGYPKASKQKGLFISYPVHNASMEIKSFEDPTV